MKTTYGITTAQTETQNRWRWLNRAFRAMNTDVSLQLISASPNAAPLLAEVERMFAAYEQRLSRFRPDSELARLNTTETDTFQATSILFNAVATALWAAEQTGGLYDPTILADLEQAGYDRSFEQLSRSDRPDQLINQTAAAQPARRRRLYTYRSLELNRARHEIRKPAGLRLDLGGIGKGWTVDRAADTLQGLGPFLINAGGDLFAYHSPPGRRGWAIDLVHPLQPDLSIARLQLHHRALATSTIAKRRWLRDDRPMHHLIDPRTGQPAQTDALSVSVVADRTAVAEVLAKVALILGVEAGLAYLERLPGIEGLIFTDQATVVYTAGLEPLLSQLDPAGYASMENDQ